MHTVEELATIIIKHIEEDREEISDLIQLFMKKYEEEEDRSVLKALPDTLKIKQRFNDQLIKLAGVIKNAGTSLGDDEDNEDDEVFTEEEKRQLFAREDTKASENYIENTKNKYLHLENKNE